MTDTTEATPAATPKRQIIANYSFAGSVTTGKFHTEEPTLITLDFATLPSEMQTKLGTLGIATALQRSYTGVVSTIPEALELVKKTLASIADGSWAQTQRGGESGPSELALAVQRAITAQSKDPKHSGFGAYIPTIQEVVEWLDGLDAPTKRAMHKDPHVARAVADIKAEKAREAARAVRGKEPVANLFSGLVKRAPVADAAQ